MIPRTSSPPDPADAEAFESVFHDCLRIFARLPGGAEGQEQDHGWVLGGREYGSVNHVFAIHFETDPGDRVDALLTRFGAVPSRITWWLTPSSRPEGLDTILADRHLHHDEREVAMILEKTAFTRPSVPDGIRVDVVGTDEQAADWVRVLGASYGWPDDDRPAMTRELYGFDGRAPLIDAIHVLARVGDRPVACSSLFHLPAGAWLTNVGTIPDARGRGAGTAVTIAAIESAHRTGHDQVWLAASLLGEPVYRQLGFRLVGTLDRWISPGRASRRATDSAADPLAAQAGGATSRDGVAADGLLVDVDPEPRS